MPAPWMASRVRGDFFNKRAIESATDLASTLEAAVARDVSSEERDDGGRMVVGAGGAATGDIAVRMGGQVEKRVRVPQQTGVYVELQTGLGGVRAERLETGGARRRLQTSDQKNWKTQSGGGDNKSLTRCFCHITL